MTRCLIGLLVTLALTLLVVPLAATAPPGHLPRIGLLIPTSAAVAAPALEAFRQALQALGYREG